MHTSIEARLPAIEAICRRFEVQKLEVFDSAARAHDFDPTRSDADFLVTFEPTAERDVATLLDLKAALSEALGLSVDLIERTAIEQSRNYIRRRHILVENPAAGGLVIERDGQKESGEAAPPLAPPFLLVGDPTTAESADARKA